MKYILSLFSGLYIYIAIVSNLILLGLFWVSSTANSPLVEILNRIKLLFLPNTLFYTIGVSILISSILFFLSKKNIYKILKYVSFFTFSFLALMFLIYLE